MKFSLRLVDLDSTEVEDIISSFKINDIFHTVNWFRVVKSSGDGHFELLLLYSEDSIEALIPLFWRCVGSLKWLDRAPATPYLFPIIKDRGHKRMSGKISYERHVLNDFAEYIEKRFHKADVFTNTNFSDLRTFLWRGWKSQVRYTIICNIDDTEEMWERLTQKVRGKIRKGENEGLKYIKDGDISIVERLINETFRFQGRNPPLSKSFYRAFKKHIVDAGYGFSPMIVDKNEKPQAGALVATYGDTSYHISTGLFKNAHQSAGTLLLWNIMKTLSGISVALDLCGANIKSIAYFKESFEGNLFPFYNVSWKKNLLYPQLIKLLSRRYFPL